MIEAVAAGATGYLQKYSRPEELVEVVLDVAEGRLRILAYERVLQGHKCSWPTCPITGIISHVAGLGKCLVSVVVSPAGGEMNRLRKALSVKVSSLV